jgi:soluble cytochrome b562
MKIRLILATLACALVTIPAIQAADAETELGGKMDKMSSAFRALRRQITDASKNADSLAKLATIKENAQAAMKLEPAWKADKPAADQAKFVADYKADMKKFIELVGKVEAALKANDNDGAGKLLAAMGDAQKAGHKQFKKPDDKKK